MSWDYNRSVERIREHLDSMGEITVEKLKREADLENLLSETNCREIFGSHVYVPVSNFARLASCATDKQEVTRMIQSVHIYQREVSRIVESILDAVRVHFQGSRVHGLFYRPIEDARKLSARAIMLQLVLRDFVSHVFNPAFPASDDYVISGGANIGHVIGTQDGVKGDRELLFVGGAANHAAHVIGGSGSLQLTDPVYDALPSDLRALCIHLPKTNPPEYKLIGLSQGQLDRVCETHGIPWDRSKSRERVESDRKQFPLTAISYSGAQVSIDLETLSIKDNKRVLAASIFADLSGFTAYVERGGI